MSGQVAAVGQNGFYRFDRGLKSLHSETGQFKSLNTDDTQPMGEEEIHDARLKKAAEDFEAIFIRQFMKSMRTSMLSEGMFGDGSTGEIYADMMDAAVAEQLSTRGALGISDVIYRQLIKNTGSEINTSETAQEIATNNR